MKTAAPLQAGAKGSATLVVEDAHTARHVGSGCEAVLATPVMIALMEAAAVDCVEHLLEAGTTSLGIRIAVDHVAPTPVGRSVTATAELTEIKGRRLFFRVSAEDGVRPIGSGEHARAVVSIDEFRRRLGGAQT
ncbi:MAG: thioesterase family protein [Deltaproteobacteria bacterium]